MEIVNQSGNIVKIFAKTIEQEALTQIVELANYEPYLDSKIRIMPDVHAGAGCTIGTTMTINNVVTPNLVGLDIGCGILVVELGKIELDLQKFDSVISRCVPSGFSTHDRPAEYFDFSGLRCAGKIDTERARLSIGTLGGGNHFIEVAQGSDDSKYLIIHTGSRKFGKDVCDYYQRLAGEEDLSSLIGAEMWLYANDMQIAQKFAWENRECISRIILREAGIRESGVRFHTVHNYIDFGERMLRKGAVSAKYGERLLIPINMRDGSLLCVGKGNDDWNCSAPHGAGRLMSRSKARKLLSLDDFSTQMSGIYTTSVGESTIDEAPDAYKSMEEIVSCISDTVDVVDILKPIYNFKAH